MKESFCYFLFFCSYVLPTQIITEQKLSEVAAGLAILSEKYYKGAIVLEKTLDSFVLMSYLGKNKEVA